MEKSLRGIGGSPVTPFTRGNKVDFEAMGKQVEFLIRNGVNFLVCPMHMGEAPNLTIHEREELAAFMVEAVRGRVPIFMNASATGTDPALILARQAEKAGASGVVLLSPYCWKPKREAHLDHFMTVGREISIGLLAYNNPGASQVEISTDILAELMEKLPNFVGIKEGGRKMEYFIEACRLASILRPEFAVFTAGEFLLTSIPVGGAGAISGCMTVAPRIVLRLYEACKRMDIDEARHLQFRVGQLVKVLSQNYPAAVKYAMEMMDRPVGETRRPIPPLHDGQKKLVREKLAYLGILAEEPHGW